MSGASERKEGAAHALSTDVLDSAAWRSLTPATRAVYIALAVRALKAGGAPVAFPVREAAESCLVNKDTAVRAFRTLELAKLASRTTTTDGTCLWSVPARAVRPVRCSAPASAVILSFPGGR